MDQRNLEVSVLSYLLRGEKELYDAREKGVNAKSFTTYSKVYEFICSHLQDYGTLPKPDTITSVFAVQFPTEVDAGFCIDLLLKRELTRHMKNVLTEGVLALENDQPEKSLEYILTNLGRVKRTGRYAFGFTDGDAPSRLEKVEQRKSLGRLVGSLFNIPGVSSIPPGCLIGIVGRTGVGKSWYLLKRLLDAYSKGKKILLISPEMTRDEMEIRWDALASGIFPPDVLLGGHVVREAYSEWLAGVSTRQDWITFDSHYGNPFTVPAISSLAAEFNPDVIGVDGLPLILPEGGSSGEGWENVKAVAYGLQSLSVSRKIHILATTQASRAAAEVDTPALHHIAYGDGFSQACSLIVTLGFYKNDDKKRYRAVPKNRFGKAIMIPQPMDFEPEKGVVG